MIRKMWKQTEQVMQYMERGIPLLLRNSRNGIRGREYKVTDFISFLPKMEWKDLEEAEKSNHDHMGQMGF